MTFDLFCSWADRYTYKSGTIEANSHDELFEKMKKFFEEACGFTGVEAFERSIPSTLKMVMRRKKTKMGEEDDGDKKETPARPSRNGPARTVSAKKEWNGHPPSPRCYMRRETPDDRERKREKEKGMKKGKTTREGDWYLLVNERKPVNGGIVYCDYVPMALSPEEWEERERKDRAGKTYAKVSLEHPNPYYRGKRGMVWETNFINGEELCLLGIETVNRTWEDGHHTLVGVTYPHGYAKIWFPRVVLEDFEEYDENGELKK